MDQINGFDLMTFQFNAQLVSQRLHLESKSSVTSRYDMNDIVVEEAAIHFIVSHLILMSI